MKLKKIASLMLAGIMAVSMLAGCSGNTINDNTGDDDSIDPGINGVSAAVGALVKEELGDDYPAYVTFSDSAELNKDLQYAVEYAGVMDIMPNYIWSDTLTGVANDVYSRLQTAVGDDANDGVDVGNIGSDAILKAAENTGMTMEDAVAVDMRAISSSIGENALNQLIAEKINEIVKIEDYLYSTQDGDDNNGSNYNHTYTVSVSTYTKTVNSSMNGSLTSGTGNVQGAADPAVTFVAIQVVRTSTHQ